MRYQKGSVLFIVILLTTIIIAILSVFLYTHSFSPKQTTNYYLSKVDLAKDSVIKTDFVTLRQALEVYRAQNDKYPSSLDDLIKSGQIFKIPQNPYSNQPYNYTGGGNNYTLTTKLGDGSDYTLEP